MPDVFVGVDVSKDHLDIASWPDGATWRVQNDARGLAKLVKRLSALTPKVIVCESTGGYERGLLAAGLQAELPMARIAPNRARNFAKAVGRLAKTDRIDALMLARFGASIETRLVTALRPAELELAALVDRRAQLVGQRSAESNRLKQAQSKDVLRDIRASIRSLERRISKFESAIEALVQRDEQLRERSARARTMPGVGAVVASTLAAFLPELGQFDRKSVAALVGVAPYNADSGQRCGQRRISAGRAKVRTMLYMAAVSATRYNPVIREFYKRLKSKGKPGRVIVVACARKMLVMLNAMQRDGIDWDATQQMQRQAALSK